MSDKDKALELVSEALRLLSEKLEDAGKPDQSEVLKKASEKSRQLFGGAIKDYDKVKGPGNYMREAREFKEIGKELGSGLKDRSSNRARYASDLGRISELLDNAGYFKYADCLSELASRISSVYEIATEYDSLEDPNEKQDGCDGCEDCSCKSELEEEPKVIVIKSPGNAPGLNKDQVLQDVRKNINILNSAQKMAQIYEAASTSVNGDISEKVRDLFVRTASSVSVSQPYLLKTFEEKLEESTSDGPDLIIKKYTEIVKDFKSTLEKALSKAKGFSSRPIKDMIDKSIKNYDDNPKKEKAQADQLVRDIVVHIKIMDNQIQNIFNRYNK